MSENPTTLPRRGRPAPRPRHARRLPGRGRRRQRDRQPPRGSTSWSPTAAGWRTTGASARPPARLLPSIAVPTTAGTGSEAQSYALISQEGTHRKMACGDRSARFRAVLLDPDLAATAPRRVAATAGIDALSHAVESYVDQEPATRSPDCYAREAWRLLEGNLERSPRRSCRPGHGRRDAARRPPRGRRDRKLHAGRRPRLRQPADRAPRRAARDCGGARAAARGALERGGGCGAVRRPRRPVRRRRPGRPDRRAARRRRPAGAALRGPGVGDRAGRICRDWRQRRRWSGLPVTTPGRRLRRIFLRFTRRRFEARDGWVIGRSVEVPPPRATDGGLPRTDRLRPWLSSWLWRCRLLRQLPVNRRPSLRRSRPPRLRPKRRRPRPLPPPPPPATGPCSAATPRSPAAPPPTCRAPSSRSGPSRPARASPPPPPSPATRCSSPISTATSTRSISRPASSAGSSRPPTRSSPPRRSRPAWSTSATRRVLFHAVDAVTGKVRWTFKTGAGVISSANFAGGCILVGSYDQNLYCLSPKDGKPVWQVETDGYVHATPAVIGASGDRVVVSGCDGYLRVLRTRDGSELAKLPLGGYTAASTAVAGNRAFVGHFENRFVAIDIPPTGAPKIAWEYEHPVRKFPYFASAAVNDRIVVVGGRDKLVHGLDPADRQGPVDPQQPRRGRRLARPRRDRAVSSPPTRAARSSNSTPAPASRSGASTPARPSRPRPRSAAAGWSSAPSTAPFTALEPDVMPLTVVNSPQPEPATAPAHSPDGSEAEVGSYFVSNYPPFSVWKSDHLPRGRGRARQRAAAGDAARPLPAHPVLPQAVQVLLLPRLHRQERRARSSAYLDALGREIELSAERRRSPGGGRSTSSTSAAARRRTSASSQLTGAGRPACRPTCPGTPPRKSPSSASRARCTQPKLQTHQRDRRHPAVASASRTSTTRSCARTAGPTLARRSTASAAGSAQLGFEQVNIDLIAGMVGETGENWRATASSKTIELAPDSVTIYQMEVPYNTVSSQDCARRHSSSRPLADWPTKRAWVDYAFARVRRGRLRSRRAPTRWSSRTPEAGRRASSTATRSGAAATCSAPASPRSRALQGVHYQNVTDWDEYLESLGGGRLPLGRGFAPTTASA